MTDRVERSGLQVAAPLAEFLEEAALPGTGVSPGAFWDGLSRLLAQMTPRNRDLLRIREEMQEKIDAWHRERQGRPHDGEAYRRFLEEIGYLVPEGDDFRIDTSGIDPEISSVAGPQLVVPSTNARYALNAANARWGSLYDALYGTDAMGSEPRAGTGFDEDRAAQVVAWAKEFLDEVAPLAEGSHADLNSYAVREGTLVGLRGENAVPLADARVYVGHTGTPDEPESVILARNGLHVRVVLDRSHRIGKSDKAGVADILLESAVSAIVDCEDSVAAVDAEDKILAYGNWLGLMRGDLTADVLKGGNSFTRRLAGDLTIATPNGEAVLKGRALLLVRNVGHLMTTPAVLDGAGEEVFEGLLDAMVTTLLGIHDLAKSTGPRNSAAGSIYVVKPKMHGPDEVAFSDHIFTQVEDALGLPRYTVKLGIMDEERRTSVNLKECIRAARHRVAFINTGFLDRTGDEIHTSMEAGPMVRKGEMKNSAWIKSYEDRNVDIGLACGLRGKAQIGKGMWAMPAKMADMLEQKVGHPKAGATCAWVPSPTAATLHAIHYHRVDVAARQEEIAQGGPRGTLDDLLTIPLATGKNWSEDEISAEIENNAQGILGYVVRWVDQGVGCSTVPDIHDVGLMEDRATCRISSQAMANWLHHGVISEERAMDALRRMAEVVDRQNADDPAYVPMAPSYDGEAFRAACDLVLRGRVQPSGYTEPVLHARRLEHKARTRDAG